MIINSQILEEFLAPFSDAQKEKILGSFLTEMPLRAENCVSSFADKDFSTLRTEAHTLKSLGKTLGATELAEQSFVIEQYCNDENYSAITAENVDLRGLTTQVCAELKELTQI